MNTSVKTAVAVVVFFYAHVLFCLPENISGTKVDVALAVARNLALLGFMLGILLTIVAGIRNSSKLKCGASIILMVTAFVLFVTVCVWISEVCEAEEKLFRKENKYYFYDNSDYPIPLCAYLFTPKVWINLVSLVGIFIGSFFNCCCVYETDNVRLSKKNTGKSERIEDNVEEGNKDTAASQRLQADEPHDK